MTEPSALSAKSSNDLPEVIMFDLDDTLAASKQPITDHMAETLADLTLHTLFAVISGGKLEQLQEQVVAQLPSPTELRNVYLLPNSGAALYSYDTDSWTRVYEELLTPEEAAIVTAALEKACAETGIVDLSTPSHGKRIEFRGASVALSVLGQQAPIDEKRAWDPDRSKKEMLREAAQKLLPEYDVKTGGMTTIDVTKKGINKAYGVRELSAHLQIPISSMLYVGDALYPGGNDEVVIVTGIETHSVKNENETEAFIKELLATMPD